MKRKCNFCNKKTDKPLIDFHEIGWNAYSIEREASKCACPEHRNLLIKEMKSRLKGELK